MQVKSDQAYDSIDAVAVAVEALRSRLQSGQKITPRELRGIWSERLRPFWRLQIDLYRALSRRLLEQGDNYLASEVADEGGQFFGDDVALILTRALATARSGAPQSAQAFLGQKEEVLDEADEAKSLLARTFKDLWKSSREEHYLQESFDLYNLDYTTTKGDRTFPGVNAASMALFLGRRDVAGRIAGEVLALLRAKADTSNYWDQVTIAECLLVAGDIEAARAAYAGAAGGDHVAHAHLATTRGQARLLLKQLERGEAEFDPCFPLPGVIAFTGHRIDGPDRAAARFPHDMTPAVKERIREAIARSGAGFGYAAAANGSDILFLECMQEAGLETYIHLPLPEEEFIRESVLHPAFPEWLERFRTVTANATEYTCGMHAGHAALDFDYGNRLMLGAASQRARQLGSELHFLTVWDGVPAAHGSGGTADYVRLAGAFGCAVEIIDLPGPRSGQSKEQIAPAPGPDQLLSILTIFLRPDEKSEAKLAALAEAAIHSEVSDTRVRIFFQNPGAASAAACAIRRHLADALTGALGLHAGPTRLSTHSLTGRRIVRGPHVSISDDLAALTPAGLIYASSAFAALLGLENSGEARSEFLGYRALKSGGTREPVFQILG